MLKSKVGIGLKYFNAFGVLCFALMLSIMISCCLPVNARIAYDSGDLDSYQAPAPACACMGGCGSSATSDSGQPSGALPMLSPTPMPVQAYEGNTQNANVQYVSGSQASVPSTAEANPIESAAANESSAADTGADAGQKGIFSSLFAGDNDLKLTVPTINSKIIGNFSQKIFSDFGNRPFIGFEFPKNMMSI